MISRNNTVLNKIHFVILAVFLFGFAAASSVSAATFEELYQQGQAAFKAGQFAQAGDLFVKAGNELQKKKDPQAVLLWGNAAICLMKAEDYASAADVYEQILAQKNLPKDKLPQYYSNLVLCRAKLNQRALEIGAIGRMLKAVPKMPPDRLAETYARQGDAYRALELYGPAAAAYDKAIRLLPKDTRPEQRSNLYSAMGRSQGQIGDYDNAEKSLTAARAAAEELGQELTMAEADSNLGILFMERGDYPQAIKLFQAAIEREKKAGLRLNEGSDWNNLGVAKRGAGNYEQAMGHINNAIDIAREVNNVKGEAVATLNRALGYRMAGQYNEAKSDYQAASQLFDKAGLQEGKGMTLMGVGRMAELDDKNYIQALQNYENALEIFRQLKMPRPEGIALLYLGHLHKRIATPGRTTRDMVFDEEPTSPEISKADALKKAKEFYEAALAIGEKLGVKDLIWEARQGLGYTAFQAGKLEDALSNYEKAIDIVNKMFLSLQDVQMLGEFMSGREDLYNEAQEVCAALYKKTGDKKYQDLMMRYGETLKNEVMKANAVMADLKFQDPAKQKLYSEYQKLGSQIKKVTSSIPVVVDLPADATKEQKAKHQEDVNIAKSMQAYADKLNKDLEKTKAQWQKNYPRDTDLVNPDERVNITDIQKNLTDKQAAISYTWLPDEVAITVIRNTGTPLTTHVQIPRKELEHIIKNDFLVNNIQTGIGKDKELDEQRAKKHNDEVNKTLRILYQKLIAPVADQLKDLGKEGRLYIIPTGFLAQVPFAALVSNAEGDEPRYLIEDFEISQVRPAFIKQTMAKAKPAGSIKKMLAVANPHNKNFIMADLPGAFEELDNVNAAIKQTDNMKDMAFDLPDGLTDYKGTLVKKHSPTEKWLDSQLDEPYEIIYLATHGMPASDTLTSLAILNNKYKGGEPKNEKTRELYKKLLKCTDTNLKGNSPLNGFLYLGSEEGDDILKKDVLPESDGLWTLKEIIGIPEKKFENTKYVILSACNTGVTFAPKAIQERGIEELVEAADIDDESSNKKVAQDIEKAKTKRGWNPDVDQQSFVEAFMKKDVHNVYGTLWFAADESSNLLMTKFMSNLVAQGDKPDAVTAYTNAQRAYLAEAREKDEKSIPELMKKLRKLYYEPLHPYFWAVGTVFGK